MWTSILWPVLGHTILWIQEVDSQLWNGGDNSFCGTKSVSVCYNKPEPLGCFDNGPDTPWCHQLYLPQDPNFIKPQFWLFVPGRDRPETINFFDLSNTISKLKFSPEKELAVIIHGFGSNWPIGWTYPMKDALVAKDNNVIVVRWTRGSAPPDYLQCVANTRVVGAIVARILSEMAQIKKLDLGKTTIIGQSLGAHVSGFAGARLPGLKRIIGLDPAGPDYANMDPLPTSPVTRLNHGNAKFVQCIHTDGLSLFEGGLGTTEAWGHVDFYANGGQIQPNCPPPIPIPVNDIIDLNFTAILEHVICSHSRAPWLFLSTILNSASSHQCKFRGFPCESPEDWNGGKCFKCPRIGCPIAGYELDYGSPHSGKFFFGTRANNETAGSFCAENSFGAIDYSLRLIEGDQYLLGLYPDVAAYGSIEVTFIDSSDAVSDTVTFQSIDETLPNNGITQKVLVGTFAQTPTKLKILYKRHTQSIINWNNGVKSFKLKLIRLLDPNGNSRKVTQEVTVNSGVEITVQL